MIIEDIDIMVKDTLRTINLEYTELIGGPTKTKCAICGCKVTAEDRHETIEKTKDEARQIGTLCGDCMSYLFYYSTFKEDFVHNKIKARKIRAGII
jgi:hypothetical protein